MSGLGVSEGATSLEQIQVPSLGRRTRGYPRIIKAGHGIKLGAVVSSYPLLCFPQPLGAGREDRGPDPTIWTFVLKLVGLLPSTVPIGASFALYDSPIFVSFHVCVYKLQLYILYHDFQSCKLPLIVAGKL